MTTRKEPLGFDDVVGRIGRMTQHLLEEGAESPYNLGLILGALQSGKTTTALALQFAGPAAYLVTGQKVFPFYLTTSQNSHEEQFRTELSHFIKYYGGIDVVFEERRCRLRNYIRGQHIDPVFELSPNLDTYREAILQGNKHFHDIYKPATLNDLIHKRVRGQAISRLAQSCQKMVKAGFTPLMIVDEPQFGASDRIIQIGGNRMVVDCLLSQIEKEIRATIGADADRVKAITGPVRMLEDKSPNSALAFARICTGRALRFRGRGGRLFFTAQLRTADNCRRRYVQRWESKKKSPRLRASDPREALNKPPVLLRESLSSPFRLARRPSPWVELSQPQFARSPPRAWATARDWVNT